MGTHEPAERTLWTTDQHVNASIYPACSPTNGYTFSNKGVLCSSCHAVEHDCFIRPVEQVGARITFAACQRCASFGVSCSLTRGHWSATARGRIYRYRPLPVPTPEGPQDAQFNPELESLDPADVWKTAPEVEDDPAQVLETTGTDDPADPQPTSPPHQPTPLPGGSGADGSDAEGSDAEGSDVATPAHAHPGFGPAVELADLALFQAYAVAGLEALSSRPLEVLALKLGRSDMTLRLDLCLACAYVLQRMSGGGTGTIPEDPVLQACILTTGCRRLGTGAAPPPPGWTSAEVADRWTTDQLHMLFWLRGRG